MRSPQRKQELFDVLLHGTLVGDAQSIGAHRRVQKRCPTGAFNRIGPRSHARNLVGHVRSDIHIQAYEGLLQIIDFGIDVKFRGAAAR
jgi:hypothetical protein